MSDCMISQYFVGADRNTDVPVCLYKINTSKRINTSHGYISCKLKLDKNLYYVKIKFK